MTFTVTLFPFSVLASPVDIVFRVTEKLESSATLYLLTFCYNTSF